MKRISKFKFWELGEDIEQKALNITKSNPTLTFKGSMCVEFVIVNG